MPKEQAHHEVSNTKTGESMNVISRLNKQGIRLFAVLIFAIAMASGSAMAANKGIRRSVADGTYTGPCCSRWDQSVTVYEPSTLVPIVVTWSTDYQSNAPFIVGLSLNGGICTLFGSASVTAQNPDGGVHLAPASYQWVILPGDYGLRSGTNVITVCGGGVQSDTDSITIWGNTLVAHLQR
jgi:hypothetical protein